ncbi:trypsin-like serine protease [Bradyrhizobium sp. CCGB12]|uniref:trypsin-like serine protease n=1 Tax=Bradyrhizobium sp. CCGB12 TaxID=2949632 RepID=UPI0020B19155|nr:trypsin-like serine protease [Bradyrhizobium sp. CCGB12]MCP3395311.1 trypsin-like serine protease [Bradyrhizobium sp. CCGB12]
MDAGGFKDAAVRCVIAGTIAFIFPSVVGAAEHDPFVINKGPIQMGSVEKLNQPGIGPELIGGKEAKSSEWPASFYSAQAGARCTATLIGPTALLLAAHCVGDGQLAAIEFREKTLSGPCKHAEGYKGGVGDLSADYALCRLTEAADGIKYERLNQDPSKLVQEAKLLLTGFGCTTPPPPTGGPPSGGNDGKFRIGQARIAKLPGADPGEPNTIVTRDQVVVCPGDSGGGAYIQRIDGSRVLAAVNSRTLYKEGASLLSSVTSSAAAAFIADWMKKNPGQTICGINLSATCR